jgi:hypothetical protein
MRRSSEKRRKQRNGEDGRKADADIFYASHDSHKLQDLRCGVKTRGIADPSRVRRPALLLSTAPQEVIQKSKTVIGTLWNG